MFENGRIRRTGFDCAQPPIRLCSTHRSTALNPPFDCAQLPIRLRQPSIRLRSTDQMLKVGALSGAETHLIYKFLQHDGEIFGS
ncbi:MAG: hypothetical protein HC827_01010 [Cyanobacteria bacterium RM1_2_2]|nr:hypothetical protein [Cyanobacteria bacterium RM1_2_2]